MGRAAEEVKITEGSGNVFADLGFENPEEELAKSKLVSAISKVIDAQGLTQAKVAEAIGIDQPQVSRLLRGRTEGYSTDRLIRILNQLGQDVEIRVTEKPAGVDRVGHLIVSSEPGRGLSGHSGKYVAEEKRGYGTGKKPKGK